jgi:hypothetical protein
MQAERVFTSQNTPKGQEPQAAPLHADQTKRRFFSRIYDLRYSRL